MSKFNSSTRDNTKTKSYEGGTVFHKSLENEWFNALFSSLLQPQFYENSLNQQHRYIRLTNEMIDSYGPDFVGKAATFSRNELGMRSVSSLTAAILNSYYWDNKRKFYAYYFHRPDDVGEVFGAVNELGNKRSHGLVRGAGDYLSTLSDYKIAKYKMNHHEINMYDLINITHAHSDTISKFKNNKLENPDTWESKIVNESDPSKREAEWKRLVEERKLGYLALIRNLRKICTCKFVNRSWVEAYLGPQLTDRTKIEKSLVWPYQLYTAYKSIEDLDFDIVTRYLEDAFVISCSNVPVLEGNTLFVLDVSGSMENKISEGSVISIKEASAVYLASYALKSENSKKDSTRIVKFGNYFKYSDLSSSIVSPFKFVQEVSANDDCGYGTDFAPVLEHITKKSESYDRIILFSDMQVMGGSFYSYEQPKSVNQLFAEYKNKVSPKCKVYSFDLCNYPTQAMSKDTGITYVTSLNNYVFKLISLLESKKSLIDVINDYQIV